MNVLHKDRRIQIFVGLLVVAAMCVSALASCACVHHVPINEEPVSCHSETPRHHEKPGFSSAPSFDVSCICSESEADRAFAARAEQKRSNSEDPAKLPVSISFNVELQPASARISPPNFRSELTGYRRISVRSGPSRAPPVL